MKTLDIMPTEENIINTIKEDTIKRNKDLVFFYNVLTAQEGFSSIAIDGKWGSGKTFFIKQEQMLINAMNEASNLTYDKKEAIKKYIRIPQNYDNSKMSVVAVYYDAWKNDNDVDPIISIVYEIVQQLNMAYSIGENSNILEKGAAIVDSLSGNNINKIIDCFKTRDALKVIKETKKLEDEIKDFFSEAVNERGNRMIIFIDELDRCKPDYAVRLLERIKHYFVDERITFVFATNKRELQHMIKKYYGEEFDGGRYLDRFFDLSFELPMSDLRGFYKMIGMKGDDILESVCLRVVDYYNMQMREITRYINMVKASTAGIKDINSSFYMGTSFEKAKWLLIFIIVPALVGIRNVNIDEYNDFVEGKKPELLADIFCEFEEGRHFTQKLLNNDESFYKEGNKSIVNMKLKFRELYEAVFVEQYNGTNRYKNIGDCTFSAESRELVHSVSNMLSYYAGFGY